MDVLAKLVDTVLYGISKYTYLLFLDCALTRKPKRRNRGWG